jgi:8-oxo-dGTP pyrophosphatase MutT (NUDIX family)
VAFAPRRTATETLLTGHVFDVVRVALDDGTAPFTRDVVHHRGAVAVIATDGTRVVLVRQWRAPLSATILEVPAGTRDVEGEDPAATAARELEEEAGVRAAHLERLCELWNAPGWSDQRTIVYLATELTVVPRRPSGPEEEAIEVLWMPIADAVALVTSAEGCDATTAVAVLALAARLAT